MLSGIDSASNDKLFLCFSGSGSF